DAALDRGQGEADAPPHEPPHPPAPPGPAGEPGDRARRRQRASRAGEPRADAAGRGVRVDVGRDLDRADDPGDRRPDPGPARPPAGAGPRSIASTGPPRSSSRTPTR